MALAKTSTAPRSDDWVGEDSPLVSDRRPLHRLNLALPPVLHDRLRDVGRLTGAQNVTEVLKSAIKLYVAAVYARGRGEILVFRRKDGLGPDRAVDLDAGIY